MNDFTSKLNKYNKGLSYYEVVPVNKCLGEDGNYVSSDDPVGYGIKNNATGVIEHTSVSLHVTMFQAAHFDDMLSGMLDEAKPALRLVESPTEDIVPTDIN